MKDQKFKITAAAALLLAALIFFTSGAPAGVFAGTNIPVTVDITVTYTVEGGDGRRRQGDSYGG